MASVNKVILLGNVGKDPEVRFTQSGDSIANFSLATSDIWTDKNGQKQERTEWHRVAVYGKAAKVVADYVKKGRSLYVEGAMEYGEYTDRQGVKKQTATVKVGLSGRVVLLGGKDASPAVPQADDFEASDQDVPF